MTTYKERGERHASRLAEAFIRDKVRQNVRPDTVYNLLVDTSHGVYTYKQKDAWIITIKDSRCILAVDTGVSGIPTIVVGKLKLSSRVFGSDRSKASSYAGWVRYSFYSYSGVDSGLDLDITDAIIEALDPTAT